jgi:cytidylate kinase
MTDRLTDRLVEYQARWSALKAKAGLSDAGAGSMRQEGPYITVSRQLGSGGTRIAERLGESLGWRVVDRQLLKHIAERTDTSERALLARDEKASGILDDYLSHLFVPDDLGQGGYLREMTRLVASFAREGRVVILGRGANWFLDPKRGLRLRIVAPLEERAGNLAEFEDIDEREAERRILSNDEEQRAFVRQTYGKDIDDAGGYDMILNTGVLDLELAVDCAATALARKLTAATR